MTAASVGAPAPRAFAGPTSRPRGALRRDIQGLRAIAVLFVVAFHVGVPGMSGGFVGVDVFFVISGYLITGLLLEELDRSGQVRFLDFYARRARRLLPALTVILVVTAVVGFFIYSPLEQRTFADTALATSLYASNLWFGRWRTDYLSPDADQNPLLHTWSLSVEEQFYLVWPVLLAVTSRWATPSRRRATLMKMLLALCVGSLALCVWLTSVAQPWAFFGAPTRAWEFGTGALGCLIPSAALHNRTRLARALVATGLLGIAVAAVTFTKVTSFPGFAALLPVLGAGLVLVAGPYDGAAGATRLLRLPSMQRIGALSYSWYLWHWPSLVLIEAAWGPLTLLGRIAVALLALGFAGASWSLVENRARFHHALVRNASRSLVFAAVLTFGTVVVSVAWWQAAAKAAASSAQRHLAAAAEDLPRVYTDGCHLGYTDITSPPCEFGDPKASDVVILFGDSHAAQWLPALEQAARERHWRVLSWTKSSCPAASVTPFEQRLRRPYRECARWRELTLARIVARNPAAVVISEATIYLSPDTVSGRANAHISTAEWRAGLERTLKTITAAAIPVLVVRDTPRPGFDVPQCLARSAWRARRDSGTCDIRRTGSIDALAWRIHKEVAQHFPGVLLLDLTNRICGPKHCPAVRAGTIVYRDADHLTARFSASLASALAIPLTGILRKNSGAR